ncbi:MAG: hypothetical protein AB1634_16450 [Thermodesulfobacteriota bacterium]
MSSAVCTATRAVGMEVERARRSVRELCFCLVLGVTTVVGIWGAVSLLIALVH